MVSIKVDNLQKFTSEVLRQKQQDGLRALSSAMSSPVGISQEAAMAVKNNFIGLNRANANKCVLYPREINDLAKEMHQAGLNEFTGQFDYFSELFKDVPGTLTGRVKGIPSICAKLNRPTTRIHLNNSDEGLFTNAMNCVPDLVGFRFILKNGTPEEVQAFYNRYIKAVKDGQIQPSHFFNYGKNPYLTNQMCEELAEQGFRYNLNKKPSGFTSTNTYFYNPNNVKMEMQLQGPHVARVCNKEHPIYNYVTRGAATDNGVLLGQINDALKLLDVTKMNGLIRYNSNCYDYARALELGIQCEKPYFPVVLNPVLKLVSF